MNEETIITEETALKVKAWVVDPEHMKSPLIESHRSFMVATEPLRSVYGFVGFYPAYEILLDEAVQNKKTVAWLVNEAIFEEEAILSGNRAQIAMDRLKNEGINDDTLDAYNERIARCMPELICEIRGGRRYYPYNPNGKEK